MDARRVLPRRAAAVRVRRRRGRAPAVHDGHQQRARCGCNGRPSRSATTARSASTGRSLRTYRRARRLARRHGHLRRRRRAPPLGRARDRHRHDQRVRAPAAVVAALGRPARARRRADRGPQAASISTTDAQVTVVDLHNLHDRAKRFVVGVTLRRAFDEKERTGLARPLLFVVLDELNKYAPREGTSPIKEILLDVAERGRSLGIILIGAQQTASEVERRIIANSSIRVVGRLDPAEAARPSTGSCPRCTRSGRTIAKPGTMFVIQPEIPVPLVVEFPFPAWATRAAERVDPATSPTSTTRWTGCRTGRRPSCGGCRREDPAHLRLARRQDAARHAAHRRAPRRARRDRRDRRPASGSTSSLVVGDLFETAAPPPEAQRGRLRRAAGAARDGRRGRRRRRQPRPPAAARRVRAACSAARDHRARPARPRPIGPSSSSTTRGGDGAASRLLPWVSQRWAIRTEQLMSGDRARHRQHYADASRAHRRARCAPGFADDAVNVVAAHCMVQGGKLGGGERDAQTIFEYYVPADRVPRERELRRARAPAPDAAIPAAAPDLVLAARPIQVDFGEEHDVKHVLLVDAPGRAARRRCNRSRCTQGRRLRTVRGTLAELRRDGRRRRRRVAAGRSCRNAPGPASPTTCARCCPRAIDVRVEHDARGGRRAARRPLERAHAARDLFAEYLDASGHARDDRLARAVRRAARRRHRHRRRPRPVHPVGAG